MNGHTWAHSRTAARLAIGCLAALLIGMAVYAVTMDQRANALTAEANQAIEAGRLYDQADATLADLAWIGRTIVLAPDPELRDRFRQRTEELFSGLRELERIGKLRDQQVVQDLFEQFIPPLAAIQQFFDALVDGVPYYGEVPDGALVDDVHAVLAAPSLESRIESANALDDLKRWQQQRVLITIVVFGVGLGLIGVLLVLLQARMSQTLSRLQREADTDSLTGLGNHRAFQDALRHESGEPGRALFLLDVDRFKEINDAEGHAAGDRVLRDLGEVLGAGFAGAAFRVGGDEFAAIAPAEAIDRQVERFLTAIRERLPMVTISGATTSWTGPSESPDILYGQADAALLWAKRAGRDRTVAYAKIADQVGEVQSARQSQAVRQLITSRTGIRTVFQPIWRTGSGLVGCEALTRFARATGLHGPQEAFAVAERDGRALDLDLLCMETALEASLALPTGTLLFINLSPASLVDARFDIGLLAQTVRRWSRQPAEVVIEITERALVPVNLLRDRVSALKAAGFLVALDDVGAGNAGLETLRKVAIDWIKIDRSIVAAAPTDAVARGMLYALMAFADEAAATVIVEGIEIAEELELVLSPPSRPLGAYAGVAVQGFLLGEPSDATDFAYPSAFYVQAA